MSIDGKNDPRPLAILGGAPTFQEPLHVGRPNIGDRKRLLERIEGMLDRRWLTNNGPLVQEFERELCKATGTKHCIPICNATIALELAARALDLKGEVIVPAFTFVATAHALQWQEITPVFADVDPITHCLDPRAVERMITSRTTGIVGVHLWGGTCDVEGLQDVADRHGLQLMFDAAHAFGCSRAGLKVGNFGRCEVFSFHATKFLNAFEGGAIATNDDDLAARIRLMTNFGFSGVDSVVYLGTNGKMSEASAAMGLTALESIDGIVAANLRNLSAYEALLVGLPGIRVLRPGADDASNHQYVVVEIDDSSCPLRRDEIVRVLASENVLARRYFHPGVHRMEPYRSLFPHAGLLLPETERLCSQVMALPNGTSVSTEDVATVASIIRSAIADADRIRQALA